MKIRTAAGAAVAALPLLLSACGGDGDDGGASTHPATAVQPPIANAGPAQTIPTGATIVLDGTASSDPAGRALSFAWVLSSRPSGSTASLGAANTAHPVLVADVAGAYVATVTVSDGVANAQASVMVSATPVAALSIIAGQEPPVSGSVPLALSGDPGTGVAILFSVDGTPLASSANGYATWNTTDVADGAHAIGAHLQFASNVALDLTRSFAVRQTPIYVSPLLAVAGGALLQPFSPNGIASVTVTLDGTTVGTLTAPNFCFLQLGVCHPPIAGFSFPFVPPASAGSQHTVVVVIVDGAGYSYSPILHF